MRVAIYARGSSESQQGRGTIGSQLEVLRARIRSEGHELVAEFCDDGYSGARLDRPGLDMMRDQAEAGAFEAGWGPSAPPPAPAPFLPGLLAGRTGPVRGPGVLRARPPPGARP